MKGVSPLTTLHVPGKKNQMTDIPSRSFGSTPEWHFDSDSDFLSFYNSKFPLPNQQSWNLFRPSTGVFMSVVCVLRMQATGMDAWRRLPKIGKFTGGTGVGIANLWDWTLIYRESTTKQRSDMSLALQGTPEPGIGGEDPKFEVARSLRTSRPLARRYPWSTGTTH